MHILLGYAVIIAIVYHFAPIVWNYYKTQKNLRQAKRDLGVAHNVKDAAEIEAETKEVIQSAKDTLKK